MATPRIGLVAFGEVGTGKSTLCNTLINSKGAFVESERTEAQTFETVGKEGQYGNQIHCPRLGDRERRLFELISSMYPGAPWYKHIAVV